jgi:hypothetical protein
VVHEREGIGDTHIVGFREESAPNLRIINDLDFQWALGAVHAEILRGDEHL